MSLRFFASVKINGKEVGRGVASSKKQSRYLAAVQGLKNIAPTLYNEWKCLRLREEPEACYVPAFLPTGFNAVVKMTEEEVKREVDV